MDVLQETRDQLHEAIQEANKRGDRANKLMEQVRILAADAAPSRRLVSTWTAWRKRPWGNLTVSTTGRMAARGGSRRSWVRLRGCSRPSRNANVRTGTCSSPSPRMRGGSRCPHVRNHR